MKIIIQKILNAEQALGRIFTEQLPFPLAFKSRKLLKELDACVKIFKEANNDMVKKLGEELPDKTGFKVKPENMAEYKKEIQVLLDQEVEITAEKLPFELMSLLKVSTSDCLIIEDFIAEPIEKNG